MDPHKNGIFYLGLFQGQTIMPQGSRDFLKTFQANVAAPLLAYYFYLIIDSGDTR
jgi:hypothetical protein